MKTPLLSLATEKYYPGDMLQLDLVGKLPESVGYTHILTAKDTFSKYLFATPLRNASAPNVAKQFFHIFMRSAYIPRVVLSDMGAAFTSRDRIKSLTGNQTGICHCQTPKLLGPLSALMRL